MFPHGLTLQATWTHGERRISPRTATIAWTRVHAITDQNTCLRRSHKWRDQQTYLSPRGRAESVRSSSRWTAAGGLTSRSRFDGHGEVRFSFSLRRSLEHRIPIRRRRRFVEEHHDRGPIEPRSRRDWAAIVDPSAWNLFHDHRSAVLENLEHDRCPIMVDRGQSRRRSWPILKQFLRLIHLQIGAESARIWCHDTAQRKPLPRCFKSVPHDRFNCPRNWVNFLFKKRCILPLKLNFWSTREKIKRVSRKVLSSRDPLLPSV